MCGRARRRPMCTNTKKTHTKQGKMGERSRRARGWWGQSDERQRDDGGGRGQRYERSRGGGKSDENLGRHTTTHHYTLPSQDLYSSLQRSTQNPLSAAVPALFLPRPPRALAHALEAGATRICSNETQNSTQQPPRAGSTDSVASDRKYGGV
jgi:hypothetical protein